jgi:hypothetical protein
MFPFVEKFSGFATNQKKKSFPAGPRTQVWLPGPEYQKGLY